MILIVLDTNVFMSGIFWAGLPAKILDAWQNETIMLIIFPPVLEEYSRVGDILEKKYKGINVNPFIQMVTMRNELFISDPLPAPVSSDPDDDKFIEAAIAGNCKIIVSGDANLLRVDGYQNIEIIKPSPFVRRFL